MYACRQTVVSVAQASGRRRPSSGRAHKRGRLALTPTHLLELRILCAQIGAQEEAAGAKPGSISNPSLPKRQTVTARVLPVCLLILATDVYAVT